MADTPTTGSWGQKDIGNAVSEIILTHYSARERPSHAYQEGYMDQVSRPSPDMLRRYPSEHWTSGVGHWQSTTRLWRSVPVLGCYTLQPNLNPGAPRQTLLYGKVAPDFSVLPDITVPKGLYPENTEQWLSGDPNSGVQGMQNDTWGGEYPLYDPSLVPGDDAERNVLLMQKMDNPFPFKPTKLEELNLDDMSDGENNYETIFAEKKLLLWNVWEMIYPTAQMDKRRYLPGYGPVPQAPGWSGPVVEQTEREGALRITVYANKGSASLYRLAPVDYDVGRDSAYPWIFPYIDSEGNRRTNIAIPQTACEKEYPHAPGGMTDGDHLRKNLGFHINVQCDQGSYRSSFFSKAGGDPSIAIHWGTRLNRSDVGSITPQPKASNNPDWCSSFTVHYTKGKEPEISYHNGEKVVSVKLHDGSGQSNFSNIDLSVEYIGTDMLICLNGGEQVVIKNKINLAGDRNAKGVLVTNNYVQMWVSNCTANFEFMPMYYTAWNPSQQTDFMDGDEDAEDYELVGGSSNFDFITAVNNGETDPETLFRLGMSKIYGVTHFAANPSTDASVSESNLNAAYQDFKASFSTQTRTIDELVEIANSSGGENRFKDDGWQQCYLDTRHTSKPGNADNDWSNGPIVFLGKRYQLAVEDVGSTDIQSLPRRGDNGKSGFDALICANVTHTTPAIFAFKIKGQEKPQPTPANYQEDISSYVSGWSVSWKAYDPNSRIMIGTAEITLVNPPQYILNAIAQNHMVIRIQNVGYPQWLKSELALGLPPDSQLAKAIFHAGTFFEGITGDVEMRVEKSGKQVVVVSCVDPIQILKETLLDTNLRFDGMSYYMALCALLRSTDFWEKFAIRHKPGKTTTLRPSWMGGPATPTSGEDNWTNWDSTKYGAMFFGYRPMNAKANEVNAGDGLLDCIIPKLAIMNNPHYMPLFHYDPATGQYILTFRRMQETGDGDPSSGGMSSSSSVWLITDTTRDTDTECLAGLPLIAEESSPIISMTSKTESLMSHYTVLGSDRFTGVPLKETAINPNWNALAGKTPRQWENYWGHTGYRKQLLEPNLTSMCVDREGVYSYAMSRMLYHMYPYLSMSGKTLGVLSIGIDGTIGFLIGNTPYKHNHIQEITVAFDADAALVSSDAKALSFVPLVKAGATGLLGEQ